MTEIPESAKLTLEELEDAIEAEKKHVANITFLGDLITNIEQAIADAASEKAWQEHERLAKKQVQAHGDICYKAGIREVVEWIEGNRMKPEHRMGWVSDLIEKGTFLIWDKTWQSFKKEKGIE